MIRLDAIIFRSKVKGNNSGEQKMKCPVVAKTYKWLFRYWEVYELRAVRNEIPTISVIF